MKISFLFISLFLGTLFGVESFLTVTNKNGEIKYRQSTNFFKNNFEVMNALEKYSDPSVTMLAKKAKSENIFGIVFQVPAIVGATFSLFAVQRLLVQDNWTAIGMGVIALPIFVIFEGISIIFFAKSKLSLDKAVEGLNKSNLGLNLDLKIEEKEVMFSGSFNF